MRSFILLLGFSILLLSCKTKVSYESGDALSTLTHADNALKSGAGFLCNIKCLDNQTCSNILS